ncbi:MAG TPA: NCS2 family permease, partial [Candidatus Paceibacterota bacterium]|nr:NCS2 family permease [Candidatus Paceibacterota bacterium]
MNNAIDEHATPGAAWHRFFDFDAHKTTPRKEAMAGLVTFMTMAYIVFVNPAMLAGAGMSKAAVVTATCLGAAVPTLLMGLWAKYPLALASGMGLNAALVMQASQPGMTWQTMMGVVVVEGALVTLLVLTGVREQVMQAIPMNLKRAIGIGIGIFIAFLGLQQMGWVAKGPGGAFLAPGNFKLLPTLIASAGLALTMTLLAFRVRGAILWGILGTAALAWLSDRLVSSGPALVAVPGQLVATPEFATFGAPTRLQNSGVDLVEDFDRRLAVDHQTRFLSSTSGRLFRPNAAA